MTSQRKFPKVPDFKATWMPIYIEPIMHSGERITMAVVVFPDDEIDPDVWVVLSEDKLNAAFGKHGGGLFNTVTLVADDLWNHANKHQSLVDWISPLSGIFVGESREANSDDLAGVVSQAVRLSSCFGSL